jgi:hypothetical protein
MWRGSDAGAKSHFGEYLHMYYSLFQQLYRGDPCLWARQSLLRGTHQFMAYPTHAKVFRQGSEVDLVLFEGNLFKMPNAMRDKTTFALGDTQARIDDITIYPIGISDVKVYFTESAGMKKLPTQQDINEIERELYDKSDDQEFRDSLETIEEQLKCASRSVNLLAAGTIVNHEYNKLAQDRVVFSSRLLRINDQSLENRVLLSEVRNYNNRLKLPNKDYFGQPTSTDAKIPYLVVSLKGISHISDAILGRDEWSDALVRYEMKKMFPNGELDEAKYAKYVAKAKAAIIETWEVVKALEEKDPHSYFKGLNKNELQADDPVYIEKPLAALATPTAGPEAQSPVEKQPRKRQYIPTPEQMEQRKKSLRKNPKNA